jgi:hypothetical protein
MLCNVVNKAVFKNQNTCENCHHNVQKFLISNFDSVLRNLDYFSCMGCDKNFSLSWVAFKFLPALLLHGLYMKLNRMRADWIVFFAVSSVRSHTAVLFQKSFKVMAKILK